MSIFKTLLFSLAFILVFSCNQKIEKTDPVENALLNLESRFPEFPKGKNKQSDFYKLIRRVTLGDSFSIEQRSLGYEYGPYNYPGDTVVFIFSNVSGQSYAFPLFSRDVTNYWNVRFAHSSQLKAKPVSTSFEKEVINAFQLTNADTAYFTARKNINELFVDFLGCELVNKLDSTEILMTEYFRGYDRNFGMENRDSSLLRARESLKEINSTINTEYFGTVYWNKNSGMVYCIDFNTQQSAKHAIRAIRVYQLNTGFIMLRRRSGDDL